MDYLTELEATVQYGGVGAGFFPSMGCERDSGSGLSSSFGWFAGNLWSILGKNPWLLEALSQSLPFILTWFFSVRMSVFMFKISFFSF